MASIADEPCPDYTLGQSLSLLAASMRVSALAAAYNLGIQSRSRL